jgi:hypothetical protein
MLQFLVTAGAALLALWAFYFVWAKRVRAEIAEGCAVRWEKLSRDEPELLEGVDRARFDAICARVFFPRFPLYALGALTAFVAALPIVLGLLAAALYAADLFGLVPGPSEIADRWLVEDGRMRIVTAANDETARHFVRNLGGIYYFFGVLAAWLLVVWIAMARFHRSRPGHLNDELMRASMLRGAEAPTSPD